MSRTYFQKPKKPLGVPSYYQLRKIKEKFPKVFIRKKKFDYLEIELNLRATPLSKEYLVKIVYNKNKKVDVFIVGEKLKLAENRTRLPHVYSTPNQRLCLYTPFKREWHPKMLIIDTIIPWTLEWLDFYEHWLIDGEWLGGGHDEYAAERNRINE